MPIGSVSLMRGGGLLTALVLACLLAAACTAANPGPGVAVAGPSPAVSTAPTPSPTVIVTPREEKPVFQGTVKGIDSATRARMTESWHPGCPVPVEDLRLLSLSHWGFDGQVHVGELVVNRSVAGTVVDIFRALFDARFPIRRMRLIDQYGGDDDRSMAANNTSAFNCRAVTGGTSWSEHSYGWAIDINPVQNPYVTSGGTILPPSGASFADRSLREPGMIQPGEVVVRAFADAGWEWGGTWSSIKDYQHFSATGR